MAQTIDSSQIGLIQMRSRQISANDIPSLAKSKLKTPTLIQTKNHINGLLSADVGGVRPEMERFRCTHPLKSEQGYLGPSIHPSKWLALSLCCRNNSFGKWELRYYLIFVTLGKMYKWTGRTEWYGCCLASGLIK